MARSGGVYWFFTALVAAIVVAIALVAVGRGRPMALAHPDRRHLDLPQGRALTAPELYELRLDLAFRGYRMDAVDDLLDRLAVEIAERDSYIGELQRELRDRPASAAADSAESVESQ